MSREAKALSVLTEFREAERQREGLETSLVTDEQLAAQAVRVEECVDRLKGRRLAVLGDPVGTGKTAVALTTARLLMDDRLIDHVLISLPNDVIAERWLKRAVGVLPAASKTTGRQTFKRYPVQIRSRGRGAAMPKPVDQDRTLVIVDEAHRGLQAESNASYDAFRNLASGCRVLFVTATPMQLAVDGLETMLQAADASVDLEEVRKFHLALQAQRRLQVGADPSVQDEANDRLAELEKAARVSLKRYLLSPFDRRTAGVPPAPDWKPSKVPVTDDWLLAYQVARVVPELVGVGKGDMFQRRLTSSTEAFVEGAAGKDLANHSDPKVAKLIDELGLRLGPEGEHPKIRETVAWVKGGIGPRRPRVVVFTVFKETQRTLARVLCAAMPDVVVTAPTTMKEFDKAAEEFRNEKRCPYQVIVLTDRFSESVDLDRHPACLVHHDLSWSPVRIEQRTGRLVRISSGFRQLEPEDVFVPVIDVETDNRIATVAKARAQLAGDVIHGTTQHSAAEELDQLGDEDGMGPGNAALEMVTG